MYNQNEEEKLTILSKNCKINQFIEICLQPKTKEEMEIIILDFWNKFEDCKLTSECFSESDVAAMYVFNYVYEHASDAPFSSVLRCLYAYLQSTKITINDYFLKQFRKFANSNNPSIYEEILLDAHFVSLLEPNTALALFLMKFRLVELLFEANENGRKILEILVRRFNKLSHRMLIEDGVAEGMNISIRLDEFLDRIKQSKIKFRRCLLTFYMIVFILEYSMYEKLQEWFYSYAFTAHRMFLCIQKLECLILVTESTTEPMLTFKDIELFTETILNRLLNAEIGKVLLQTSKSILFEYNEGYNTRSLKDLARCKVRFCFQSSKALPKQVMKLAIPNTLKQYLTYDERIWDWLKISYLNADIYALQIQAIRHHFLELQNFIELFN